MNLLLRVGPRRADGFHDLRTVFHAVDLVDEVLAAPSDELALSVSGEGAGVVPEGPDNLAWRAAQLLADTAGLPPRVRLELTKAIPVAGGMAGGSADAAAALVACAQLWDLDVGPVELATLAARLGSDTVFPLVGGTAVGTGRGEVVEPIPCAAPLHWVFALADGGIPAGAAYACLDELRASGSAPAPDEDDAVLRPLIAALGAGDVEAVAALLHNDLQAAALHLRPGLRATLEAGRENGALAALVSGSGPTCAFLCPDRAAATVLAAALEAEGVCRTARVASGPAAGARVAG